ncbi:hypothetical protein [Neopusillimonas aromaticivorans]|uniref:hypothetical protein n=1 Tax=Neopusillimonas aromaticivorans TaxID=2979868 RepID=UPI002598D3B7|nr:hypothetical protein [Neopusillimonas aromaticivorans]WJJ93981.1 hypothetical protein N7E01_02025 [Neopusillimonas aromaticivorans]
MLWDNTSQYLRRCVRNMNFTAQERISVYAHVDGWFILAGRFSPDPQRNDPRRRKFPFNEGCIGKAWNSPEACHGTLPNPDKNLSHYVKMSQRRFDLPESVARDIRMKSRQYYARALQSDKTGTRVGVIVLESLSNSCFNSQELNTLISGKEEHLASLVMSSAGVSIFLRGSNSIGGIT